MNTNHYTHGVVLQAGTISNLAEATEIVLSWPTIGWVIFGIILGIILGSLPGIGPLIGMAVLLPLTAPMQPGDAIIFFVSMYLGGLYGGSIAAILLNAPGTAAAAATTLDGYPMTRKGLAFDALVVSAVASAIGGVISIIMLIAITPILTVVVLSFGSPEYFLIALLGIVMITIVSKGSLVKGITAGVFGLMITTIGIAPMASNFRYGFHTSLFDGIEFVAVLIGLFAVTEMFRLASEQGGIARGASDISGDVRTGIISVIRNPRTIGKSSLIGISIGAMPGAGSSIANFIAYAEALRSDEDPGSYGTGNDRGVMSSEASNSASGAGSLIPTLSFGIPGSATAAVLLGALLMHGLQPGPSLFSSEIVTTYSFFIAMLLGNILIFIFGILLVSRAGYLTKIDTNLLIPIILVFAIFGAFAVRLNWVDILSVFVFGVLGFFLVKHDYSIIAFILGVVLGPIAEINLYRSLQISDGSVMIFLDPIGRPISFILVILIFLMLFMPIIQWFRDSDRVAQIS